MHSQSCVHSLVACELSGALTCLLPLLQPKPILSCCIAQTIMLPQVDVSDAVRAAMENGDLPPHRVEEAPSILSLSDSATCSSDQNTSVEETVVEADLEPIPLDSTFNGGGPRTKAQAALRAKDHLGPRIPQPAVDVDAAIDKENTQLRVSAHCRPWVRAR